MDDQQDAPAATAVEAEQRVSRAERPQRADPAPDAEPDTDAKLAPGAAPAEGRGQGDPAAAKGGGAPGDAPKRKRSKLPIIILVIIVVLGAIGGTIYWFLTQDDIETDDAYTDGNVITITPRVSGYVVTRAITDNQFVHKGDLLIQIDPRDYEASRQQAQGQLDAMRAQLANAQVALDKAQTIYPAEYASAQAALVSAQASQLNAEQNYRRQHGVAPGATTQQNIDTSTASLRQAQAQVDQAQQQVKQASLVAQNIAQARAQVQQLQGQVTQAEGQLRTAELNLSYTTLRAPADGWITKRNVNVGDYMTPGQQIMSLVTTDVWITANYKEGQLNRMRIGQPVTISVDAYPGLQLKGQVNSIQLGSGSKFTAFPPENATGNFVKIVQRVPVKIVITGGLDPNLPLPLGLSVEPTVDVGSTRGGLTPQSR